MRVASWIAVALVLVAVSSSASVYLFEENRGQAGIIVPMITDSYIEVSLKLDKMSIDDVDVLNDGLPNKTFGSITRMKIVVTINRDFSLDESFDVAEVSYFITGAE